MNLPKITHLQAAVLLALQSSDELYGRDLRQNLCEVTNKKTSLAAFYQMMARLEDAGLVEGRYQEKTVDEVVITERVYKITGEGSRQLRDVAVFYEGILPNAI